MCVFKVVVGLASQGFDDVSLLLGHTICHGHPTGHYGAVGVPNLWSLGRP